MKLNLSEEWYAREFRKDAEEPVMPVTAGRIDVIPPHVEESAVQQDNKRVKATSRATPLPPKNTPKSVM